MKRLFRKFLKENYTPTNGFYKMATDSVSIKTVLGLFNGWLRQLRNRNTNNVHRGEINKFMMRKWLASPIVMKATTAK